MTWDCNFILESKPKRGLIEIEVDKDEWSGLAELLANLIEKYALELDIEHISESQISTVQEKESSLPKSNVENIKAA